MQISIQLGASGAASAILPLAEKSTTKMQRDHFVKVTAGRATSAKRETEAGGGLELGEGEEGGVEGWGALIS